MWESIQFVNRKIKLQRWLSSTAIINFQEKQMQRRIESLSYHLKIRQKEKRLLSIYSLIWDFLCANLLQQAFLTLWIAKTYRIKICKSSYRSAMTECQEDCSTREHALLLGCGYLCVLSTFWKLDKHKWITSRRRALCLITSSREKYNLGSHKLIKNCWPHHLNMPQFYRCCP